MSSALSPKRGHFISVYQGSPGGPYYSIYSEKGQAWTTGLLPMTNVNPVFCSFGNGIDLLITVNPSFSENPPVGVLYTTFNGSSFPIPTQPIPGSGNVDPQGIGYCSFNSYSNLFMSVWLDATNSPSVPYFAAYDGVSWTTGTNVPGTIGNEANSVILSTANSQNGDFMITWYSLTDNEGYYSFGAPSSLGAAHPIPNSGNSTHVIFPSFDSNTGSYIVTWVNSWTGLPTYTIFDGSMWSTPAPIPGGSAALPDSGVVSSLDPVTGTLLFCWLTSMPDLIPYYATYNSNLTSPWSTPAPIPGGAAGASPLLSAFDPASKLYLVAWNDFATSLPIFDTFTLKTATTTTVTTSPNPSNWLRPVQLTAQVVGETSATARNTGPSGIVTFYVNGEKVGHAPVAPDGTATLNVTITCPGDNLIKAIYSGDADFAISSGSGVHTVECFN